MKFKVLWIAGLMLAATAAPVPAGMVFNFSHAAGMDANAVAGFVAAGNRWSGLFSDNITVNINIGFSNLGSGILASAGSAQSSYSYSAVKSSLINDKTSADDFTATANLQAGPGFNMLLNRTANNPAGTGSATTYLDNDGDANNTNIRMTNANAKALGLLAGNNAAVDAAINFSSAFSWDFDPTDGISGGVFDFIGIATHEIGHALGFISGVDVLDGNASPPSFYNDNEFTYVSTLDLYRYSDASKAVGAIDWTADNRTKYFSIDGGATNAGATFSNGIKFGDGRQASHWKDSLGLGIMDPTAGKGELLAISANDIRAFDVIGYNLAAPVPEPASLAMWGFGALGMAFARRKRRQMMLAV